MPFRIFIFLLGFGLCVTGFSYILIYLNLFSIGYNFFEYVKFIIRRIECLNFIFGIILMLISIFYKGGNNELYI